jgi:hypothetical protein
VSTTLTNLKVFTTNFDVDLHGMDRRLRATFSRAILQRLLEASAEVPIIAYMISSSSSAYGSSFHDNGDGNDKKKNLFTPGKRKSTRDNGDDGNDNGAPNGDQEAKMTPNQRPMQAMMWAHSIMALRTGRTGAAVGTMHTSQSPSTRRRPTAGAKVAQHRLPRHS